MTRSWISDSYRSGGTVNMCQPAGFMIFPGVPRAVSCLSVVGGVGWVGGMEREGRRLFGRCPAAWRGAGPASLAANGQVPHLPRIAREQAPQGPAAT